MCVCVRAQARADKRLPSVIGFIPLAHLNTRVRKSVCVCVCSNNNNDNNSKPFGGVARTCYGYRAYAHKCII